MRRQITIADRYKHLLAARVDDALQSRYAPPSPCVSVCKIDSATRWCVGCLRTLDEIGEWANSSDEDKRAVWGRIASRLKEPAA